MSRKDIEVWRQLGVERPNHLVRPSDHIESPLSIIRNISTQPGIQILLNVGLSISITVKYCQMTSPRGEDIGHGMIRVQIQIGRLVSEMKILMLLFLTIFLFFNLLGLWICTVARLLSIGSETKAATGTIYLHIL